MTALHLAKPDDLERLLPLVAAYLAEMDISLGEEQIAEALAPLLEGSPHGAVYLIGPARAPLGYIAIAFGWSLEAGGMVARIDALYIRPAVRGRGIASEVLVTLPRALGQAGVKALHLEIDRDNDTARRLHANAGFAPCERSLPMRRGL